MKVLWVNPSFLDYRIPVYQRLNELLDGEFYLIYSVARVPERVSKKITEALGENAIGLNGELVFQIPSKGDFSNTEYKLPYQPGLYKQIAKVNADVVIAEGFFQWTPAALLWCRANAKKLLIAYERTAHTERNCPKWRSTYRKLITRYIDGYLVNGQLTSQYLSGLGVPEEKILLGGMSADSAGLVEATQNTTSNDISDLKERLALRDGITYLCACQLIERKGLMQLISAWKKHTKNYPTDNLIIVGTGPLHEKLLAEAAGEHTITFTGHVDYSLIHHYYSLSDVFILPTLEDNWSLVVPEAMACSLPIACSIYNGCYPELVLEGKNGKLFDPLRPASLVETLAYFHGQDLEAMGRESKRIEQFYSFEKVSEKILAGVTKVSNHTAKRIPGVELNSSKSGLRKAIL